MFVIELLFAIVVALFFSSLLVWLFGWQRPDRAGAGAAFVFLFILMFLVVWAGGTWIRPFGPIAWGVAWLPFIIIGVLMALLFLALIPPPRMPRDRRAAIERAEEGAAARTGAEALLGAFFWVLVVLLLIAVVARYLF